MAFESTRGLDRIPEEQGRSQIPLGVQDHFLANAATRRQAEANLRSSFSLWGYSEVISPTFEYYDNLSVGASARLRRAMYRFFDTKGQTLALRADFTPQMARMAATKLYDLPMPLRCFYIGSLFRREEPQAGRKREFTQAGVELVGADTAAADAEVVALAAAALKALGLEGFQINLGQMAFFHSLSNHLPAPDLGLVMEALDRRNSTRLDAALAQADVAGPQRRLLRMLPELVGGPEVLAQARALCHGLEDAGAAISALDRLAQVFALLEAYGIAECVIVDLAEVRGMDYYSGITFRGVAPRLGWPVVSGGRYDGLIGKFGRQLAAVGFGLGIERVLLQSQANPPALAAQILVQGCGHARCLALVQRLRSTGVRVEVDVMDLDEAGVRESAHQRSVPRWLCCSGEKWQLSDDQSRRIVDLEELLAEAEAWALDSVQ